jgi:hypothetical protein
MNKRHEWLGILALAFSAFCEEALSVDLAACDPLTAAERGYVKFFPGHYVAVGPSRHGNDQLALALNDVKDLPAVVGIQKRYYWSNLQTGPDNYDFTIIKNDIAKVKAMNKRLSIFLVWKFSSDDGKPPVPEFMKDLTTKATTYALGTAHMGPHDKGTLAAMDNPVVADGFIKLLKKLANEFDNEPAVSSLVFVETAMGTQLADYAPAEKSVIVENYYKQVLRIDKEASCAFKHTPVIQLTNFPNNQLGDMTEAYKKWGIAFGGPDVWLNDPTMKVYDYYPAVSQEVPVGMVAAGGNYIWQNRADEVAQDPSRLLPYTADETIQKIYTKAKNELNANYIFWKRNNGLDKFYDSFLKQMKDFGTPAATIKETRMSCPPGMESLCKSDIPVGGGGPVPIPTPSVTPTPTPSPSITPPEPIVLRDGGVDRRVRDGWGDEIHIH